MEIKKPLPGKERLPGVADSKEPEFKMPKTKEEQEKLAKKLGIKKPGALDPYVEEDEGEDITAEINKLIS